MPRLKELNEGFEYNLKKSLRELGQLYDILCAADGEVLDGYHREKDLKEDGVKPRYKILEWCKTQEQKLQVRRQTNLARRLLSAEARTAFVNERAEELERMGVKPLDILKRLVEEGYSQKTVYRYIQPRFKPRGEYNKHEFSSDNSKGSFLIPQPPREYDFLSREVWVNAFKKLREKFLLELLKEVKDHYESLKAKPSIKAPIEELIEVLYSKLEQQNFPKLDENSLRFLKFLKEEYLEVEE